MLTERKHLASQIQSLNSKIQALPEGKLICTHNGNRYKWYKSDGKQNHYIPKSDHQLAEQLAAKKYFTLLLQDLLQEQKAIDYYLKHHSKDCGKADQMLDMPEYRQLLSPFFNSMSSELLQWMNFPYEHNPKYPEQLIHKTISGNYVRSKSEAMIAMILQINQIPFRYECSLNLPKATIYPDFTIRHPKTGTLYYWEHFGLMDDPSYYKNTYSKLQLYASAGIIPGIQLITTYETKEYPLNTELVEKIIAYFFL